MAFLDELNLFQFGKDNFLVKCVKKNLDRAYAAAA